MAYELVGIKVGKQTTQHEQTQGRRKHPVAALVVPYASVGRKGGKEGKKQGKEGGTEGEGTVARTDANGVA